MLLKSRFIRFASVFCLIFSLTALTFADTIRLKDGSIIKGKIVNFNGGKFTVVIGDGSRQRQMNFAASEIESIVFDNSLPDDRVANNNSNNNGNSTIITVGQNKKPDAPNVPPIINNQNTKIVRTPKPIEIGVKVLADNTANGWTNSGWVVKKGQRIKITATGRVSLGGGRYSTATGINSLADKDKLMPQEATGGLIAVVGDNNNEFIFVGESREFVATRDGALFLGVNEGNLDDNSGAYDIKIEISPEE